MFNGNPTNDAGTSKVCQDPVIPRFHFIERGQGLDLFAGILAFRVTLLAFGQYAGSMTFQIDKQSAPLRLQIEQLLLALDLRLGLCRRKCFSLSLFGR